MACFALEECFALVSDLLLPPPPNSMRNSKGLLPSSAKPTPRAPDVGLPICLSPPVFCEGRALGDFLAKF